ncbi:MAG: nucleotide sugar dehydrogenase [Candidatus Sericytochromatia bacterium]|nr:nucleotide sugar dehydrogenase [Candidatus Sericytochromatia bacterium]
MTTREIAAPLTDKLLTRQATVAIIGLGYVGLPLCVAVAKVGFRVIGLDLNADRVAQINRGESYIEDVPAELLGQSVQGGKLRASTDFSDLKMADVIIICVPTPLTSTQEPDISYIRSASQAVCDNLQEGQLIILESTTYPGTTEEVLLPALSGTRNGTVGEDFFLAFSPERVDPGNHTFNTTNTTKVVGGVTPNCLAAAVTFYSQIIAKVVPVSSPRVAELTKVFENTFRAVNIALVNELAMLCDKMGINVWEVIEAAGTKPFGMMTFFPGPGVGGHCIPIDPYYLTWKAREFDFHTRFIELCREINMAMPRFVRDKVIRALNQQRKSLNGANILVVGVAYKKDISDWRESPAVKIIHELQADGAEISYNDPHIAMLPVGKGLLSSVELTPAALAAADVVLITTDHTSYDYDEIVRHASVVVDTRNATRNVTGNRDNIILL